MMKHKRLIKSFKKMKRVLFFVAIAAIFTLTSCGMGGGNQPVMVEEVEAVEVDSIPIIPQPDTSIVKVDSIAKKQMK